MKGPFISLGKEGQKRSEFPSRKTNGDNWVMTVVVRHSFIVEKEVMPQRTGLTRRLALPHQYFHENGLKKTPRGAFAPDSGSK